MSNQCPVTFGCGSFFSLFISLVLSSALSGEKGVDIVHRAQGICLPREIYKNDDAGDRIVIQALTVQSVKVNSEVILKTPSHCYSSTPKTLGGFRSRVSSKW